MGDEQTLEPETDEILCEIVNIIPKASLECFTKLKEEHECTIAHEVKSKQRDVISSLSHQKLLKDSNNILKFRKIKSIIYLMDHISEKYSCINALQYSNCFLKSCFFCHKPLGLHKEVYMYRGELGFCSVDCRNRQIYLDELKKIETFTKKILISLIQRRLPAGRCTQNAVPPEDNRQRGKPSSTKNQVTFTLS